MSSPKNHQYKLVLLGETAVGKSSLVLRFVKKQFSEYQDSTIGAAFMTQSVQLSNETTVKFEIWDTAGQERYHSLAPMYYRRAPAAIVVYDITAKNSLNRAKSWVHELQKQGDNNIIIAIAGNKLDMVESRQVDPDEVKQWAQENNCLFLETSAKNNINVTELFKAIAVKLVDTNATTTNSTNNNTKKSNQVFLDDSNANTDGKSKPSGCC